MIWDLDTDRPHVHGSWLLIWRQFLGCFSNANSTSILILLDLEMIFFQWNMMFNIRKLMFSWRDLLEEVEPSVKKVLGPWHLINQFAYDEVWKLNIEVCFDFFMIKLSKVEIKTAHRVFWTNKKVLISWKNQKKSWIFNIWDFSIFI